MTGMDRTSVVPASAFDTSTVVVNGGVAGVMSNVMAEVERMLERVAQCPHDDFTEVTSHYLRAGGKRVRARLAVLSAAAGAGGHVPVRSRAAVVKAAAVVELVHVASLHHDDVMDRATTRRGVASVNYRWDDRTALLAGDYLLAQAAMVGAMLGPEAVAAQATALTRLVNGQVAETWRTATDDESAAYLRTVKDKTGALFGLAAQLGAIAVRANRPTRKALERFGETYGVAFQMADDLRDTLPAAVTGKDPDQDVRNGVRGLPAIPAADPAGAEGGLDVRLALTEARRLASLLPPGPHVGGLVRMCDDLDRSLATVA